MSQLEKAVRAISAGIGLFLFLGVFLVARFDNSAAKPGQMYPLSSHDTVLAIFTFAAGAITSWIFRWGFRGNTVPPREKQKTAYAAQSPPPAPITSAPDTQQWHSRRPMDLRYSRTMAGLTPPDNLQPSTFTAEIPRPTKRASRKNTSTRVDKHGEAYGDLTWPPPKYAIEGKELVFTYSDEHGEISDRRVIRWRKSGYATFDAWCLLREEQRTFRIDRVLMWGEG